ncbi:Hypothetical protein CINCED_3A020564 [Cinara cedri]|uniref:DUF659 domain-containing protein n=1 Tax=Cinara cedri TaxID=506608 RepID=A0A5E4MI31_9HEMI|nr:Hypothetical protein CINCED_3A020564 [Cinara cedri]
MLSANIPLNKLGNVQFKQFLEKYTGKQIPAITTLRKCHVDEIYSETINKIRNGITGKKIWVSIDETTDSLGRSIANVVIGTLETDDPGQTFFRKEVRHDDVLLFLSDAASYMVKSGNSIQVFYPKVIHVTYIVHGLHLIAEKNHKAPNILLPPAPILTRWGTWIRAAVYYCEHLEIIKSIVDSLNKEDAIFLKQALRQIYHAIDAVQNVNLKLSQVPGLIGKIGYQSLIQISKAKKPQLEIHFGEAVPQTKEDLLSIDSQSKIITTYSDVENATKYNVLTIQQAATTGFISYQAASFKFFLKPSLIVNKRRSPAKW